MNLIIFVNERSGLEDTHFKWHPLASLWRFCVCSGGAFDFAEDPLRTRLMSENRQSVFTSLVFAAIAIGVVGRSVELTLPMVLSSAGEAFALDSRQLGFFAMAEVLGVTLASASSWFWNRRLSGSTVTTIGIVAFTLGNLATPFVPVEFLITTRFLTALFGEGFLLVVATAALGSSLRASQIYAAYMALQMIVGAVLLFFQGYLASAFGIMGVMGSLVVLGLAALATIPVMGRANLDQGEADAPESGVLTRSSVLVLAGMGFYHVGIGGAWAFLQERGAQLGLDFSSGGQTMAMIMMSGLIGTGAALFGGRRFGHLPPLSISTLGLALAGAMIGLTSNLGIFVAGGIILMVAWNLSVPYQIAFLGEIGRSRRQLGLVPGFQGAGLAAGPMVVGLITTAGDYSSITWLCLASALFAALAFYLAQPKTKKKS